MGCIVVRLADLEFLTPLDLSGELTAAQITEAIRRHFDYLPGELVIQIKDGVATVQFEEASAQNRAEARRLFEKAWKRAKSGEFRKAKDIYGRVLELDPAMTARLGSQLNRSGPTFHLRRGRSHPCPSPAFLPFPQFARLIES